MSEFRRICLVGGEPSALFPNSGRELVGGEAVQQSLLAKALIERGLQVTIIVGDYGQPRRVVLNGIEVLSTYKKRDGLPIIRFIHPRITSLLGALGRADADVYYQSPASAATGITAWFCQRYSRRFIFRVASDANCIPGKQLIKYWRDRRLYEYGLRRADTVAAQTRTQVALLERNYGIASSVVNMIVDIPELQSYVKDIDVLWVSNLRAIKHPEKLLRLAKALPTFKFTMVGGPIPGSQILYDQVKAMSQTIPNLHFVGPVSYAEVPTYFERAKILVNTSSVEGFPNTFLQAWARCVPVISFFDPDNLIQREKLGAVPQNLVEMECFIVKAMQDNIWLKDTGQRAYRFVSANFCADAVVDQYLALLETSVSNE